MKFSLFSSSKNKFFRTLFIGISLALVINLAFADNFEAIQSDALVKIKNYNLQSIPGFSSNPKEGKLHPEEDIKPLLNAAIVASNQLNQYLSHQKVSPHEYDKEFETAERLLSDNSLDKSQIACANGECDNTQNEFSDDIKDGLKALAISFNGANEVSEKDSSNPQIFTGTVKKCEKYPIGLRDCCKDTGWGAWIKNCPLDLQELLRAKKENRVIAIGSYKNHKLGKRRYTYCVFPNKIAAIVQRQGRFQQLSISFGDAKKPDCRGLTPVEFSSLDFNLINFKELEEDLVQKVKSPDENYVVSNTTQKIEHLYSEGYAHG